MGKGWCTPTGFAAWSNHRVKPDDVSAPDADRRIIGDKLLYFVLEDCVDLINFPVTTYCCMAARNPVLFSGSMELLFSDLSPGMIQLLKAHRKAVRSFRASNNKSSGSIEVPPFSLRGTEGPEPPVSRYPRCPSPKAPENIVSEYPRRQLANCPTEVSILRYL